MAEPVQAKLDADKVERDAVTEAMRAASARHGPKASNLVPELLRSAVPERLHLDFSGHFSRQWVYHVPAGTEPEMVLAARYWAPVHRELIPHDRIRAIDEFGAWEAWLAVRTVDPMGVEVGRLYLTAFDVLAGPRGGPQVQNKIGAVALYRGPQRKWSVEVHGRVLRDGFHTYQAACQWLGQHLRVLEASP